MYRNTPKLLIVFLLASGCAISTSLAARNQQSTQVQQPTQVQQSNAQVEKKLGSTEIEFRESKWHGFRKQSFTIENAPGFIVVPDNAAPGNPWIWRTSFPDFHAEVDLELVRRGFHIGFLNVVKMLGSDSSLDKMDKFYDVAVD